MEFTFSVKGSEQEMRPFINGLSKLFREMEIKPSINVDETLPHTAPKPKFKPGQEGYYIQLVWEKITVKAKRALLYIATHDGCTKEEIVNGLGGLLTDTRDLGGALSSVSRRCKALLFNLNVIYEKVETANGPRYYMADDAIEAIKFLGQNIDNNDPADVIQGDPDEE